MILDIDTHKINDVEIGDLIILKSGESRIIIEDIEQKICALNPSDCMVCITFKSIEGLRNFYLKDISKVVKSEDLILSKREI